MAELFEIRKVEWRKWKAEIKKLDKTGTEIAKKKKIRKLNGE